MTLMCYMDTDDHDDDKVCWHDTFTYIHHDNSVNSLEAMQGRNASDCTKQKKVRQ